MNTFHPSMGKHIFPGLTMIGVMSIMLACIIPGIKKGPSTNTTNTTNLLPEPSAGLAELQSYKAVYELTLEGSIDGKPYDRQSHLEYSFVTQSKDEESLWQERSTDNSPVFRHTLRQGQTLYAQSQDGQDCWGGVEDPPQETVPQPASLLPAVTQASQVSSETVNGIATTHYHFDRNGISSDIEGVAGEVWIAQTGGYVVKYMLRFPRPAKLTGKGVEVAETMSYELTGINSFAQIDLPETCVAVLVDIPALTDARDLYRGSGMMIYTSQAQLSQAVDFYNQAIPGLGWIPTAFQPTAAQDKALSLAYTLEDQSLTVFLDRSGGSLEVIITLADVARTSQAQAETPGPAPTKGPKPTADASKSGLPEDVPLFPGATDLIALPNVGANFSVDATPESVAEFYREQLTSLDWDMQTELKPASDSIVQTWSKSGRLLVVSISVNGQTTTVMLALSNQ